MFVIHQSTHIPFQSVREGQFLRVGVKPAGAHLEDVVAGEADAVVRLVPGWPAVIVRLHGVEGSVARMRILKTHLLQQ